MQEQQRQGSGSGSLRGRQAGSNPLAEFQLAEQVRQVETLQQQLAFREQEVGRL